jgi:hypothetical protein
MGWTFTLINEKDKETNHLPVRRRLDVIDSKAWGKQGLIIGQSVESY